ncbi:hypothetical protein [Paenibacillus tyrfis]|uniref:hypothetical protein n=1 Tax=Paenibacillus tyrfis TaxID=1501230 RepID=UPI00117EEB1E
MRTYTLHLLQRSLAGNIASHLPPTFINHMVNETEEAMRIFAALTSGQLPPPGPSVHQHLLCFKTLGATRQLCQDNLIW